ncbi:MAG TPA: endo alpha-1,4 polygalactosaminidase [Syntrophorhabdus sp.]|nr:endo alpha-1,4 polygalactosaminidase [Syntrophorhabdus sp.]
MRPMSSLTGKIGCSVKTMENRSPVCPVLTFTAGIIILFLALSSALLFAQEIWVPPQRTSWQWQLNGRVNQSYDVDMYDIDLFETDPSVVLSLHDQGKRVICYFSAGSLEQWRPDASAFPPSVIGKPLAGWPGERWLDIRKIDIVGPIMAARLDLCREKGFDGVETDNIEGYANDTGFPLTYEDQLKYNAFLAHEAHARGLSIGLKNDLDQIPDLVHLFDWALNEQCFQFDECHKLMPFIEAGKAVFHVEYKLPAKRFCSAANELNFNSLKKRRSLKAWRKACR